MPAKTNHRAYLKTGAAILTIAAMIGQADRAEAAIVNSVTNIQATPIGATCRISWDESVTANVDDGGNIDFYAIAIANFGGSAGVTPTFTQVSTFGTTTTFSRFLDATVPLGSSRYDKYIQHRDVMSGSSPIISQVQIPDSVLAAAGGSCLNLRANNEPTVDAGSSQSTTQFASVTLSGSASDLESDPLTFQWSQTTGASVTLSGATTLTPSFVAPAKTNAVQTLTFSLAASDGFDTSTDTVDVTVAANVGPTANAGPDGTVGGGTTGTLDGSGSTDGDGDALTYSWTQTGGPAVTLNGANTVNPSFTAPAATTAAQTLTFELIVSDGLASSAADGVTITVPDNAAPTVNAGPDATVSAGASVSLSGSASDLENDPLTYQWTQSAGPGVTLSGATTLTPSFIAPAKTAAPQLLTFQLVADDGNSSSAPDTVDITILGNVGPTANAGPDATLGGGTSATLDGSGSVDGDGDPLTYQWTQVSGPAATLSGATTANPTFTVPPATIAVQTMIFELIVSDGIASSAADTVTITIPDNVAPTVDAGPDATATGGSSVTLSGTASDLENDPLTYQWTQSAGPGVTLSGATTLTPSFTAPAKTAAPQVLTFQLVANDGNSSSAPDTVDITIPGNADPSANAGNDATFPGGSQVFLEGSGTDPDGDPVTLVWTQVSGPAVVLNDATTQNPSFIAPAKTAAAQVLTFGLVVSDGIATSPQDTVDVTIPGNIGPIANAGADASVAGGAQVTLDGSGSLDGDGDPLTFAWVQTGGPAVTLSDAAAISPSFVAPFSTTTAQVLTFDLVVSDGLVSSPLDSVAITVAPNAPPVADAGTDQGPIDSGSTVTLDGSGSSDPDGDPLTYAWTQVAGPAVTLSNPSGATPTFTAPVVQGLQDLVFSLTVSDGQVTSAADTVTIGVRGVGTVTIVQRVIGSDTSFTFTSDIAALNGSLATNNGTGQLVATGVAAGSHSVSVADLSVAGLALTEISCNDSDSVVDLASRSVAIALAPNEDLVCTFTSANSREAAVSAITDFLTGRNALILSMQPDLQRRLDRLNGGMGGSGGGAVAYGVPVPGAAALPFSMALGSGQASFSTSLATAASALGDRERGPKLFDLWTEAYFADTRLGSQEGSFRIVHIGADYLVGKDLLVGVLGQFDEFRDKGTLAAGEAEGDGWMVGPYAMARLAPGLFGELRAAWGASDNRLSPLGSFVDSFETSRSFYSGSIVGQFDLGKSTRIRPEIAVRHLSEKAEAYTDSLDITIPGQTVSQGDVSFRPRIQHALLLEGGWSIRPFAELEGIYTFGTATNSVLDDGLRARVEGGVDLFSGGSFRSSLSVFHDGIGAETFRSTGVHVAVSFGF
ncbi:autotransporter outer membrane beta-barrel domain-containing protein [Erythrobacter sp. JK5]|uniref:autotransporter outer membrane beta-barrel domain-containing protein n=1 Tax=Erythrobacter sp. JK5 TaxID=2829500 RepID=UPI001BAB7D99|nr:autotransporter outer membrane beta-barrel domain-containing protein [Erythrobacter sp. JK5]QUL36762.1 autotransporter domain-containing protein [Erythrobacter sp. JK5]